MSTYRLTRDITINARPADVFAHLGDLRRWQAWSPWAKLDPDAAMGYSDPPSGEGAYMDWEGNRRMGAGRMTVLEYEPGMKLRYRLDFRRPMADSGEAAFELKPAGDGTRVYWTMTGEHNLLGRILWALFVRRMVNAQFDEGLDNLKSVAEG